MVLFRQFTPAENARLASTAGPFATLSRDGRWLVTGYWVDAASNDAWVADFAAFLKTGQLPAKVASVGVAGHRVGDGDRRHAVPAHDEGRAERPRGGGERL